MTHTHEQLTGISFLDRYLPSGNSNQAEVLGILSSTGSGRTTAASMISAEGAVRNMKAAALRQSSESSVDAWVFVTDQETEASIWKKVWGHLRLESGNPILDADRGMNLKQHWRYCDARNLNFRAMADPIMGIGLWLQAQQDICVTGVVIDCIGTLVAQYADAHDQPPAADKRLMKHLLGSCRQLAVSHNCPVWVTHHLRGAVGKESPRKLLTHRDAAGCSSFGDHLDYCFVLGNHDRNGLFAVRCTKGEGVQCEMPTVVSFQSFATIAEVSSDVSETFLSPKPPRPSVVMDDETAAFIEAQIANKSHLDHDRALVDRVVRAVSELDHDVNVYQTNRSENEV